MTNLNRRERGGVRARLTGLHKATKRLADGRACVYAYAFKGGPLIARAEGRTLADANAAMERELGRRETLAKLDEARKPVRVVESKAYIQGLVTAFLASPEFSKTGAATQREYRRYLESFRSEFGSWKVKLFEDANTKTDLLDWRDDWSDRPRAADYAMQSVGRLFKWARGRGLTNARPTDDVERLHTADRSEIIWTDADLARLFPHCSPQLKQAIRLACETGLRLGDLLALPWADVRDDAIVTRTSKRKRQVVIPLTPACRKVLAECERAGPIILTNSRKRPWTPDGFKHMFREARTEAGITGLRFHDLRGTFATRVQALNDREMADVLGWSEQSVRALRIKYVSSSAVALDLLARMKQKRKSANRSQTGSDAKS